MIHEEVGGPGTSRDEALEELEQGAVGWRRARCTFGHQSYLGLSTIYTPARAWTLPQGLGVPGERHGCRPQVEPVWKCSTPSLLLVIRSTYFQTCIRVIISTYLIMQFYKVGLALAGVAQCVESHPENQRVVSSIPNQGTCLGWGQVLSREHVRSSHTLMSPSLPPLPSLKINK